jgi:PAS domain S-box-containing protein
MCASHPHVNRWGFAITILILLITAGFGFFWRSFYREQLLQQEREIIANQLFPYTKSLENSINRRFALLAGLTAFIHTDSNDGHLDQNFESFAASLHSQASGIRNFSVFPGGVAKYVYPLQGNEVVIGHNLLEDERPNVRTDVQHAIETRQITLSGPYELRQGGWGLVARQAIFMNDQFWGFGAMALDMPPILEEAGIDRTSPSLLFAIRGQNGQVIFGEQEIFESNPVVEEIRLPEATWQMAAIPEGGWGSTVQDRLQQIDINLGIVGSLLMAVAVGFLTYQNQLQREVKMRTQSLAQQRDLLNRLMETSPVGIVVINKEGQITNANLQAQKILELSPEEITSRGYNAPDWHISAIDGSVFPEEALPFAQVASTLSPVFNVMHDIGWDDGRRKTLSVNAAPLFDKQGEFDGVVAAMEDVTRKIQAEKALQESEMRYHKLFENASDGIFISNQEGYYLDVNSVGCSITGYSREEILKLNRRDLVISEDLAMQPFQDDELRMGKTVLTERRFIRKDGSLIDVEINGNLLPDGNFLGIVRNISERKRAEETRRQLEEKFTKAFHISPDAININRLVDGLYIDINEGFTTMTGFTLEDVKGKTSKEIDIWVNPADRQRLVEGLLKNGEYLNLEAPFRIKNGQVKTCLMSAKIIEIDGETCILSITRDITELNLARQALIEQVIETTHRTWELEALAEITASLRTAQTRGELTSLMVKEAVTALNANAGAVALVDNNRLVFPTAVMEFSVLTGKTLPQKEEAMWQVIDSGEMVRILNEIDVKNYLPMLIDEYLHGTLPYRVIAPLKIEQQTIGALLLGYDQPQEYDEMRLRLLTAIADMAGSALHRMGAVEKLQRLVLDRTHDLDSIYRVTSAASEANNLQQGLQNALELALEAIHSPSGNIFLLSEDGQSIHLAADVGFPPDVHEKLLELKMEDSAQGVVIANNEPFILQDILSEKYSLWGNHPYTKICYIGMPMRVHDRVVGVISALKTDGQPLELEEMTLFSFIADHLGLLIENMHLSQQAEAAAVLEERARLARDLHDSVTQSLYSATLFAEGGRSLLQQNRISEVDHYLVQLQLITRQALKEMRLLVFELRSSALAGTGLADALQLRLEAVEERSGVQTHFEINNLPNLPPRLEENIYRIAIEALNNILKHANASQVQVHLTCTDNLLELMIGDDGNGFDPQIGKLSAGMGLTSMRERAHQIGGDLKITSQPGTGTVITLRLPINIETNNTLTGKEE